MAAIRRGDFTFTRRPPPKAASTPPQQPPSPPQREGQSGTATPSSIEELLAQHQDVLNPSGVLKQTTEDVAHHLQTRGPPIASKFRRLDAEKLAAAKKEFLGLEQAGIVRRSNSPWASPLHMVRKQDGSWRPCGKYRCLNSVTIPHTYPIPSMLDFANRAAGCTHFSKIDLKKVYHQVPMVEWTKERRDAFQAAKAALRKATHLTYPKAGAEMALMVDASAAHIGAALQQRESATAAWQPLSFFSKKLDATQQRYSA